MAVKDSNKRITITISKKEYSILKELANLSGYKQSSKLISNIIKDYIYKKEE